MRLLQVVHHVQKSVGRKPAYDKTTNPWTIIYKKPIRGKAVKSEDLYPDGDNNLHWDRIERPGLKPEFALIDVRRDGDLVEAYWQNQTPMEG